MRQIKAYFSVALILIVTLQIHSAQPPSRLLQVLTNSRTETLFRRCPTPRAQFYNAQYNDSGSWGRQQTAASLKLNGDALIYDLLTNDTEGATQEIRANLASSIIYVIFMAIGLLLLLIFAPIMVCCCCNPLGCPPCCRKDASQPYTSCQRNCPAAIVVFLCIVAIVSMIGMLIVNPELQKGYSDTRCSTSIILDDLLNGNYTKDGSRYFIGLKPLRVNLSNPLSSTDPQATGNQLVNQVISGIQNSQDKVAAIPSTNGDQLQLFYVSPLNLSPSSINEKANKIKSTFPSKLGTKQQPTSLIGKLYQSLSSLKSYISQSEQSEAEKLSEIGILNNSTLAKYAQLTDYVETMDKNTDNKLQEVQDKYILPLSIVIYAMAGVVLGFSVVLILSALCICCCKKFTCRRLVYLSCVVLTLMGILCFLVSLLMSAATAGSHYGCHYVEGSLQTRAEFEYRFKPVFNNDVLTKMVAQCVTKEGTGIVVNSSQPLASSSASLSSIVESITSLKDSLAQNIKAYRQAQILDIDSPLDMAILRKLSDPAEYSCSEPTFSVDSWVPSTQQLQSYIPCRQLNMPVVTPQTCGSLAEFQAGAAGCTGCIDTTAILQHLQGQQGPAAVLAGRYPQTSCRPFATELTNVWFNYYKTKQDALAAVEARANQASLDIDSLLPLAKQIPQKVGESPVPLQASITHLDCKVLGEDLQLVVNTFCTQVFNYSFKMRVFSIMGSFALLLIMFCATCLGMRSYNGEQVLLAAVSEGQLDNKESENVQFYLKNNPTNNPSKYV